jgi:hypothetical protein
MQGRTNVSSSLFRMNVVKQPAAAARCTKSDTDTHPSSLPGVTLTCARNAKDSLVNVVYNCRCGAASAGLKRSMPRPRMEHNCQSRTMEPS